MWSILIVDDEEKIRKGLIHQIDWESFGFFVKDEAENGEEAWGKIVDDPPDVVLTDIRMSKVDGIELLKLIREKGIESFVVLLSGYSDFRYAQDAIRYGAFSYLVKPIKQNEVRDSFMRLSNAISVKNSSLNIPMTKDVNIKYLIPNYLSRLINGYYRTNELNDINSELCISDYQNCIVAVMTTDNDRIRNENVRIIEDIIMEFNINWKWSIDGIRCFGLFSYKKNEIVLFFFYKIKLPKEDFMRILLNVKSKIEADVENQFGSDIRLVCSQSKTYPINCCKMAYEEASKLQSYYFFSNFLKKDEIILSNIPNRNISDNHAVDEKERKKDMLRLINDLCRSIIEKQLDESIKKINLYFDLLEKSNLNSKEDIMMEVTEMIFLLSMKLKEINMGMDHLISDDDEISIKKMMEINNFFELRAYVRRMIILIIEELNRYKNNTNHKVVDLIKIYINENIEKQLSLDLIAKKVYLNPSYISKLFKEYNKTSFSEYVTAIRIEKAKELLKESRHKIDDIAKVVGFDNQKYFSRVFKMKMGFNPSQYRKLLNL